MGQQVNVSRDLNFNRGEAWHSGNITGRPSFRNTKVFYDDFFGATIDTAKEYNVSVSTGTDLTATNTAPDCLTLTTGTETGNIMTVAGGLSYYGTYGCAVEIRARNDDVAGLKHFVGFSDTSGAEMAFTYSGTTLTSNAADAVGFFLDYVATTDNYYGASVNNGTDGSVINSGKAGTNAEWITYRVEIVPRGTEADAYFYMNTDGNEIDPFADMLSVEVSAVKSSVALCLNISVLGTATADTFDVDYVKVWGGRY